MHLRISCFLKSLSLSCRQSSSLLASAHIHHVFIHSFSKYTASPRGAILQAQPETFTERCLLSAYYTSGPVPGTDWPEETQFHPRLSPWIQRLCALFSLAEKVSSLDFPLCPSRVCLSMPLLAPTGMQHWPQLRPHRSATTDFPTLPSLTLASFHLLPIHPKRGSDLEGQTSTHCFQFTQHRRGRALGPLHPLRTVNRSEFCCPHSHMDRPGHLDAGFLQPLCP